MKLVTLSVIALFGVAPLSAHAAAYALHGTFFDYGSAPQAGQAGAPVARRVPAVLYVALRGREAHLRLFAPGARCVPELGDSHYVGPAHFGGPDSLAIHVDQKSDCVHLSDDARLLLRFTKATPRGVGSAVLTDHVRRQGGPVLFQMN